MKRLHVWLVLVIGLSVPWLARAAGGTILVHPGARAALGVSGIFQYDWAAFRDGRLADGRHRFNDNRAWRRQEIDVFLRRKGVYKITVGYDFAYGTWTDNYVGFDTSVGTFHVGEFRTLVGWESASTSGAATTFIEASLPVLAVYEGRRAGVDWTWTGLDHWTFQAQWFAPHDLNHEGDGQTVAARVVYAPIVGKHAVVHVGLSASGERREDGHAQFQARPEARLTPVRLIGTRRLDDVRDIHRRGLELAWMHGPWLAQGEYLTLRARRRQADDFRSHGGYVSLSWMLTGESRGYKKTAFGNPAPHHAWGAIGVGVRYSRMDLTDGPVRGGREHDWTLGINWYIGKHCKVQVNDVYAVAERGNVLVNPHSYELRAQITF